METASVSVRLLVDPPGIVDSPAPRDPHVVIHVGAPVGIACERAGQKHRGVHVHGDIDIVPAGVASRWILEKEDTALVVRVPQQLLQAAAADLRIRSSEAVLLNRFQFRDPPIEHLGWAMKIELDQGFGGGQLYMDSIGMALACRLLRGHSAAASKAAVAHRAMPGSRLRRVLAYIEENLADDVSLAAVASTSGLSVSHCQRAFRASTGLSIHQYVIRRRVDRAKSMLTARDVPLSEVALLAGFAHQSHLAYHMRRVLGTSPHSLRRSARS